MPLIQDTAYPRLEACPSVAELACFTPTPAEMAFVTSRTRRAGPRLALLVLLKTFQRLGYFLTLGQVPAPIVEHLAHGAGLTGALDSLPDYDGSTYRVRLMALVRVFVGVTSDGHAVRRTAVRASVEAARARDEIADIININAAIEELVRQRFELPAFGTLLKIAGTARAAVNRGYHRQVTGALAAEVRQRLNDLLVLPPGQRRTAWDRVKTEPKQPTPRHMQDFLRHLDGLRDQGTGTAVFAEIPPAKVRQFAAEARVLTANVLSRMVEPKRLALMAALLQSQTARTLDDLADMFIRQLQRMHARAQEALRLHQSQQAEQTDALIMLLRDTVLACRGEGSREERLAAIEGLLLPDADTILERCAAHAALAGHNHLPFLTRFYRGRRRMFLRFLETVPLVSTSQDRTLEQAIAFLLKYRTHHHPSLRVGRKEEGAEGCQIRPR